MLCLAHKIPDRLQEIARRSEQVNNAIVSFGPIALKGTLGIAIAGAGGSFLGSGLALAGATYGFNAGKENCICK
jgi:hypothetical protein